ncbi:MAG: right-handed parallel beta-helix repeat-containing protein [Planctomycetes bacterium]|nr:right-handed parallel beta-helix repeat-containing protein [Planctomycetota bacterium]
MIFHLRSTHLSPLSSAVAIAFVGVFAAPAARAEKLLVPKAFPTIQEAVTAAAVGDEIVISSGIYNEDVLAEAKQGITIRAAGNVRVRGSASSDGALFLKNCVDVTVKGIRFEQTPSTAVRIEGGSGIRVEVCKLINPGGDGIAVVGSSDAVLKSCFIDGAANDGIEIHQSPNALVTSCRIEDSGVHGVRHEGSTGLLLEKSKIVRAALDGVSLSAQSSTTSVQCAVRQCAIQDCGRDGIALRGTNNTIEKNVILKAGDDGIEFDSSFNSTGNSLLKNTVVKSALQSISIHGTANTAAENKVLQSSDDGIIVSGAGQHVLSKNVVANPRFHGIRVISTTTACTLTSNVCTSAGTNGFFIQGDSTTLTANKAFGADQNGFAVTSTLNIVSSNSASGSGVFDLNDTSGGGNIYTSNKFKTSNIPL